MNTLKSVVKCSRNNSNNNSSTRAARLFIDRVKTITCLGRTRQIALINLQNSISLLYSILLHFRL